MTRSMICAAALACAAAMACGCNNNKSTTASKDASVREGSREASAPMNTTCPYSGGKVNQNVTSQHEGKTVGFCCDGCKGKFDGSSEAERDAMVSKAR